MGRAFAGIGAGLDERDYDRWLTILTEASARLDALETAIIELRQLCASGDILPSDQVIAVLGRYGAAHVPSARALM